MYVSLEDRSSKRPVCPPSLAGKLIPIGADEHLLLARTLLCLNEGGLTSTFHRQIRCMAGTFDEHHLALVVALDLFDRIWYWSDRRFGMIEPKKIVNPPVTRRYVPSASRVARSARRLVDLAAIERGLVDHIPAVHSEAEAQLLCDELIADGPRS